MVWAWRDQPNQEEPNQEKYAESQKQEEPNQEKYAESQKQEESVR